MSGLENVLGSESTLLNTEYLTISRRRQGDYKPIFTQPKANIGLEYRLVITEPEATNCFSINFQVFTNNNQHNFIKIHFKFIAV